MTATVVLAGVVTFAGAFGQAGQLLVTIPPRTALGQVVGPLTPPSVWMNRPGFRGDAGLGGQPVGSGHPIEQPAALILV